MTGLVIPLLISSWLVGQAPESTARKPPSPAEIAAAVERLGSNRFAEREAATEYLWKAGRPALAALESAAKDKDLERARRAQGLLEKVRWGILPDTPPEIIKLIGDYRLGSTSYKQTALRRLRDLQRFDVIVDLLQANPPGQETQQLMRQFSQEIRAAAVEAVARNDAPQADKLLRWSMRFDAVGGGLADYATFLWLTGDPKETEAKLRREVQLVPGGDSARLLALHLLYQGRNAEAREVAASTEDELLKTEIDYRLQDWAKFVARYPIESATSVDELGHALFYRGLTNDRVGADQAVAALQKWAVDKPEQRWSCRKALLLNERWREADELAKEEPRATLELLCDQMRLREALELLGPRGAPGWSARWYSEKAAEWEPEKPEANTHFFAGLQAGRALQLAGERDEADRLFDALAVEADRAKHYVRWRPLLEMELRLGRREPAERRAIALLEDDAAIAALSFVFFKKSPYAVPWWEYLRHQFPTDDRVATWHRLRQLLQPGEGSPFPEATLAELVETAATAIGALPPAQQGGKWAYVADAIRLRGDSALAIRCYERQVQAIDAAKNNPNPQTGVDPAIIPLLKIGDEWVAKKDWKQAAAAYEVAWARGKSQPLSLYLRGHALVQTGAVDEGRELIRQAKLLPLGDPEQRRQLATGLQERGLAEEARAERRQILLLAPRTSNFFAVLNVAETEAKETDSARVAETEPLWSYLRLCLHRGNTMLTESLGYRELAQVIHKGKAWAAIDAGRWDEALAELKLAQAARPGYASFTEQAVQKLDAAGRKADADAIFGVTFDLYDQTCRDFPQSAFHHNAAAWMAAQSDRRLDDALKLAESAVKLKPDTAAYLDTLAEVHFRRGDFDRAIELEKKAVALAPDDKEIREQLQKFEAAAKRKP